MSILKKYKIKIVAKKALKSNSEVIRSLKQYDEGKKKISTSGLEKRLPNIRVAKGR